MKKKKSVKSIAVVDRNLECLVCGKCFPRYPNDLERHIQATTLKHFFSNKLSSTFRFGCLACQTFFTTAAHLSLHEVQSSCASDRKDGAIQKNKKIDKEDNNNDNNNNTSNANLSDGEETIFSKFSKTSKISKKSVESIKITKQDRTVECMVCGKLFHRGPIDLARHGAAITLKHVFANEKSDNFSFECEKKCGFFFTNEDHAIMHAKYSTCNPDVVMATRSNHHKNNNLSSALTSENNFSANNNNNKTDLSVISSSINNLNFNVNDKRKRDFQTFENSSTTSNLNLNNSIQNSNLNLNLNSLNNLIGASMTRSRSAKVLIPNGYF
jgi:hypothetical protein